MTVTGPLNGLKILDLTHVWAGPLAVRFLADMGAQVVRVEAPDSRGPQQFPVTPIGGWLGGEHGDEPWNDNALFAKLMRNRRSVCLDLKAPLGRQTFLQLVAQVDVVVENFSARAMDSLDLGSDVLFKHNPELICVRMPGFGLSGPLKDRVAFGPTVEAMSGLTQMMGYGPDEPRNTAMALLDPISATNAAAAILRAVRERAARAEQSDAAGGVLVEMSLHEGGVTYNGPWLIDTQLSNQASPECVGNRHPAMVPHGIYVCEGDGGEDDTWIALACSDEAQWQALAQLVEGLDPSLSFAQRCDARDSIDAALSSWCANQARSTLVDKLQAAGVSAGAVNSAAEFVADPQVVARKYFAKYERYDVPMPGCPINMEGLDQSEWQPCPKLGQHNAEVLQEWLGLTESHIESLYKNQVIADRPPV